MEQIARELDDEPWDLFYMGLHLIQSGGRVTRHLGRFVRGFHSHAYAVSVGAVGRLLTCIERMLANPAYTFDSYPDSSLVKLYGIPILAIQEPNWSYTFGRYVDRLSQYFTIFDGEEFEDNCEETRNWQSNWRNVVTFRNELNKARVLSCCGLLEQAVTAYKSVLHV